MPSIALVVLDTLRKDAFDRHFDWLPGSRFDNAFSTSNWTVPAHASLFSGRYASEVGVHTRNRMLNTPRAVLAESLQDEGYTTRAFSANPNITGYFDFDRGFSDFRVPALFEVVEDSSLFDWREFLWETETTGLERYLTAIQKCIRSDSDTMRSLLAGIRYKFADNIEYGGARTALSEIRSMDFGGDEFLFLNLMEPHAPYRAPDSFMTVGSYDYPDHVGDIVLDDDSIDRTTATEAYNGAVSYLSNIYEEMFFELQQGFDYVITLSDHGELLGEHDHWTHAHGLYPELVEIPLNIYGEGFDEPERTTPVSLLDVHSTVEGLAGIADRSRGRDLSREIDPRPLLTEFHGLPPWSKEKLRKNGYTSESERYDEELLGLVYEDGRYVFETRDGIEGDTRSRSQFETKLKTLTDGLSERAVRETDPDVPAAIEEHLEDLGYG